MHIFEFVLAIVSIVFAAGIINNYIKTRSQKTDSEELASEFLEKLDRLEERIKVLERIVTDRNYDLKEKFKDLGA